MKVQGNRYINNPEMIKNKVEKKTTVPQNIISEDDVKISDSARKLVETARNKVSDFHTMHFSSINGEIREIPAEYKCENLFKLDLKATSISGEQSAFEGCLENQSEVFEKWLDENASEYLTEDEMKDLKEGMILKGTVRNVIDFGAFVDIDVHQDGLVHISKLTDKKFVKHPLDVVSVGDVVDVKVLQVDMQKKRIQLSMIL